MKITNEIFASYLRCKFKAYLQCRGERGSITEFEKFSNEALQRGKKKFRKNVMSKLPQSKILENLVVDIDILKQSFNYLFNVSIESTEISAKIDAIEKITTQSKLGNFLYIPILILPHFKVSKIDKLQLAFCSLLLADLQDKQPEFGKILYGYPQKALKVKLDNLLRETHSLINEIKKQLIEGQPPKLILNRHCQICEFRDSCLENAIKENNLSLLRGLKEKEIKSLNGQGIFTVLQLSYTFRPRRKRKKTTRIMDRHYHALKALAIREEKVYIYKKPFIPTTKVNIYLDVEGDPDRNLYYLIGMIVDNGKSLEKYSYWINDENAKEETIEKFLDVFNRFEEFTVFHYGNYEVTFLRSLMTTLKGRRNHAIKRILDKSFNILSIVYTAIYFPTYSNELKEIANYLGFEWSMKKSSGLDSITWRRSWENNTKKKLMRRLILYNMEDCFALKKLTNFIFLIAHENTIRDTEYSSINLVSEFRDELLKRYGGRRFGKQEFIFEDFNFINKRAYFEYQRNKIYVRTEKKLMKVQRQLKKELRYKKEVNQEINIGKPKICPNCKSRDIYTGKANVSKIIVDLKFIKGGVKKWIAKYIASYQRCKSCGKNFISPRYKNIHIKYGHNLISWVIYQNIVNGISFEKIEKTLANCFQISIGKVGAGNSYYLKTVASEYYSKAYKMLRSKISTWKILHIDETKVSLRDGTGYVWVFTNMIDVFFMFSETRETDHIEKLLKEFDGVLISDFYKGYDGLKCKQQKCLIHLMRDINDTLFKHQQDAALIYIAQNFSSLLRKIVETIDKHGLKKRNLNKHKRDVDKFYKLITTSSFDSEFANKFIKRFKKYRDTLFTFLDHDGVPWNNNNAEHPFKHFAAHRRGVNGLFTEDGLRKHLILLSIYETCNYRGINFHSFLLSKEKSIDEYLDKYTLSGNRKKIYNTGYSKSALNKVLVPDTRQHDGFSTDDASCKV